jgi:PAS domain S-box-containing protein
VQLRLAALHYMGHQSELQRRTQAELRETRERFRALTENAFDMMAELDEDERLTYVNPRYEEALGYPARSFLGRRPAEFVHPDDQAEAARFAAAAAEDGHASGLVIRVQHRDGTWRWLENVASSFLTEGGERRWVMNSRDVTQRKAREETLERGRERLEMAVTESTAALHESEARFRALADHAPELISEFDDRGRYTFANAAFRELLGRDPRSMLGTTPEELIHPEDLETSRRGLARALTRQSAASRLHRLRHADGSWRWFDNTGRAYRTTGGELRFVSIGRDVTDAVEAEEERKRIEAHMQEVQRLESLGVLAGGIAHDFNNLLAVILGNATLLEAHAESDPESKDRLRRIRAAARHAEALTDQMLAYAGQSVSERVPLDLSEVVRDTEDLLRAAVPKTCRLELDLGRDLPPVEGDATRLRQVLVNLVSNAGEALGERPGHVRVRTTRLEADDAVLASGFGAAERPAGEWVMLEVSDDGPGMDAELRQRVFEPFFTTRESGRGLGLAAVLGIASAHGGVVTLDSQPGAGSVFRLLLRPSAGEARPAEPEAAAPPTAAAAGTVLVVDDDEAVREVAQALLERAGLRVECCAGGHEALARIRGGSPIDAVLLDLAMPELSGAEVLRRIRSERPDLPVVIASGYKRDLASDRLDDGATFAFVHKPYDPEVLVATLREAVRSGRGA